MVKKKTLVPLTSLRFVAAFMVLCHHYYGFDAGYVGVTFFFVLSGFILAYNYENTEWSPLERRHFWWKRVARVYPTHILTLVASLPFAVLAFLKGDATFVLALKQTLNLILNILLLQSWVPVREIYFGFNAVSWSISTEAFFYFMFPLIMLVMKDNSSKTFFLFMIIWGGALVVMAAIWSAIFPNVTIFDRATHFIFYISPLSRIYEFVLGIVLAKWLINSGRIYFSNLAELFALVLSIGSIVLIATINIPSAFALSLFALPASIVVVGVFAYSNGWLSIILSHRIFVLLGEASFMLYMIHVLVRRYMTYLVSDPLMVAILSTIVSVLLSLVLYKWFEKPAHIWLLKRSKLKNPQKLAIGSPY